MGCVGVWDSIMISNQVFKLNWSSGIGSTQKVETRVGQHADGVRFEMTRANWAYTCQPSGAPFGLA